MRLLISNKTIESVILLLIGFVGDLVQFSEGIEIETELKPDKVTSDTDTLQVSAFV